jgi:ATP-dependent Lhr-like helicase
MHGFHPAVSMYFARTFGAPTPPQARAWPSIQAGRHVLVAAPTGSGKTLAGFMAALDALVHDATRGPLPDETRVLYVSPLKALSHDVERNLRAPLAGIDAALAELGRAPHGIRVGLRTGDTPARERTKTSVRPPHVFVTTPESLYILLTSDGGRRMLRTVRTVIVDEIHATLGTKRGAHLALSLERLDALAARPVQRIGLSATQRPLDLVARFLVGAGGLREDGSADCDVIDEGHARPLDLALEVPGSPLEPVMASEVWEEVHGKLAALASEHATTIVFVNTRRMAERLARALSERVGKDKVAAHHGSLAREVRLDAEQRLKRGELCALVATASLELGIDVGSVDLVCQIGSPRAIAALLQRVGRSGHFLGGLPKGRLFPTSLDDLVECLALLEAARSGELDCANVPTAPLDVLAQQIVAEVSVAEWSAEALWERFRRALSYQGLLRETFDEVVRMLSVGFATRRGRRGALVHFDAVRGVLRGRRGARLVAVTSGGAIPENTEYAVVEQPEGVRVGSIHEDFAIESSAGDVFQLGTTSWRILRVVPGVVHVEDAKGQPPTIPFWLGEAPGRTRELSAAVRRLLGRVEALDPSEALAHVARATGVGGPAAEQAVAYLHAAHAALGALPSEDTIVAERFFDEAGNTHLVIHSRHGARLNRAWGLALRKTFCRSFNFELQAAATDDAIILSLGPTHSFPLDEVFSFLTSKTAERTLVQAVLDAPVFAVRWRWAATVALAVPRMRGGKKTPPPLQRMLAEDLLTACFPDAQACLENVVGDREVPDHPLVRQTLRDCLEEAMDVRGLVALLERIERGEVRTIARDVTQPSPLAAEILGARPYAFLDDAPLEERRTQAVMSRRFTDVVQMGDLAALDPVAVARVRDEAWPEPRTDDEVHDALVVHGLFTDAEARGEGPVPRGDLRAALSRLAEARRATRVDVPGGAWVAAERLGEIRAVHPHAAWSPAIDVAPGCAFEGDRDRALRELARSRLEALGPVGVAAFAAGLGVAPDDALAALTALEVEGFAMRGRFSPGLAHEEWCERRLLARIHRATMERLRREIEPVSPADFARFLFQWQRVSPRSRARGPAGLELVVEQLEGFEAPAGAWEPELLASRVIGYDETWLDALCFAGRVVWARGAAPRPSAKAPVRSTPIVLVDRRRLAQWETLRPRVDREADLSEAAQAVLGVLRARGAVFREDLVLALRVADREVGAGLAELVARGFATSDSWSGLRALIAQGRSGRRPATGRWALVAPPLPPSPDDEDAIEVVARALLRRWGVVFRRLLDRESALPPWRDLVRVLRRMEARGEVRGGRFVALHAGEQFALPEAVGLLREIRRSAKTGEVVSVSAVDPLALVGIVVPGERVPALAKNRIAWLDGVPAAVLQGEDLLWLVDDLAEETREAVLASLGWPARARRAG